MLSTGGMTLPLNIARAEGSSLRTAVTVNGSGPGPVLVTVMLAWPKASVTLVGELSVAPPVAIQLMVTPAAFAPLSCALTTRGEGSGVFGAAVWLSPLTTSSVRTRVELSVKVCVTATASLRVAETITGPGVGPRSITALDWPEPLVLPPLLTLSIVASPLTMFQVMPMPDCGVGPRRASTTSGAGTCVLIGALCPLPDTIASVLFNTVMVKLTESLESVRLAVTVTGPGPGPRFVTLTCDCPELSVEVLLALSVAPPLAIQVMLSPEAGRSSLSARITRGKDKGPPAAPDCPSPLTLEIERRACLTPLPSRLFASNSAAAPAPMATGRSLPLPPERAVPAPTSMRNCTSDQVAQSFPTHPGFDWVEAVTR